MRATRSTKCIECPCRVQERLFFVKRNRCAVHGRYVGLDDACTLTVQEAQGVHAFMARILCEKSLPQQ